MIRLGVGQTDLKLGDLEYNIDQTSKLLRDATNSNVDVLVLPELAGKLNGFAVRVPTLNVSLVDLTFLAARDTSTEEVNAVIKSASENELKGILEYNEEPLVSIDFNDDPRSSIFDASYTKIIDRTVKVLSWYDNEWAFSLRMLDTTMAFMNTK